MLPRFCGGEVFWNAVRGNLSVFDDVKTLVDDREWRNHTRDRVRGCPRRRARIAAGGTLDGSAWRRVDQGCQENQRNQKARFYPTRCGDGPELKHFLPVIGRDKAVARLRGEPA